MRQEPHRVYWQQWSTVVQDNNETTTSRELITKSAAVRISDAARAQDVTQLLRSNLGGNIDGNSADDSLVLIATLFNTTPIEFQHTLHDNNDDKSPKEPYNIVKTLQGHENPLQVRDALLKHVEKRQSQEQGISPKLQWFFIPSCSTMPYCIEIDGYCTSDEQEAEEETVYDDDDDDHSDDVDAENRHGKGSDLDSITDTKYWWRNEATLSSDDNAKHSCKQSREIQRQEQRLNQLRNCLSALDLRHVVSGFLLLRSNHDKHVWRKVHCVLTDDYLWIVSRLYNLDKVKIAKHGRISLNRALLMQQSNASQVPFSFQVVSKSGISHVFRAPSQSIQEQWMTCIKARITQTQENDFMQHAELIVEDEALAHNKRMMSVAVKPLLNTSHENDGFKFSVLKFGMQVAEYREACRQVQSQLPAKRPVVVAASTETETLNNPTPRRLFETPSSVTNEENDLDSDTKKLMTATWDLAKMLLARATLFVRTRAPNSALETLCHHVEFVITGRFQSSSTTTVIVDHSNDAPPVDLFDALLAELQSGGNKSQGTNGRAIETPIGK